MRGAKRRDPGPPQDGFITALVRREGDTERVTVRLDSSRPLVLAASLVEREGLHVGDRLSADVQERLIREDQPFRARDAALRLLTYRDRSAKEVETRLRGAGFDPALIAPVIAWLHGLGYLDDRRFARRYVLEKARTGWGPHRIRAELARKGVDRAVVDEALAEPRGHELVGSEPGGSDPGWHEPGAAGAAQVGSGADSSGSADSDAEVAWGDASGIEAALALSRRRFGGQLISDPQGARRRLAGFLARRGYDWDTIACVERILLAEAEEQGGREAGENPVS